MASWKSKAWNVGKEAVKNIKKQGLWGGEYVGAAVTGALGWGTFSGVTEWARGGSFWDGAVGGALTGGMMGAGYRALKIGATGPQWHSSGIGDVYKEYRNMWESKAVTNLRRLSQNARIAKNVKSFRGRYTRKSGRMYTPI
jgi:hypothetical protein